MKFRYISRTVWTLSLVSLFTDTASEMLYPVMPVYLRSIGFSILLIGILEGIAEATAGLSKGYFGKLSDNSGKRTPFVQLGYGLSAISKPLMAIFIFPLWVFMARTIDRLGKGIRTGARDAILSDEATSETKGKIFGFHRSMDTFGAVLGPSLALFYLYLYPEDYKTLFFIAVVPGILAILTSFSLHDRNRNIKVNDKPVSFFSFIKYWKTSPSLYRKVVIGLLVFALFNSSDVFLLLRAKSAGLDDTEVIGVYIFYNLIYALFSYPLGVLADRVGLRKMYISGIGIFAVVYLGMGYFEGLLPVAIMFFLYGIYAAATEGISKAWISNIADKKDTATAIGTYSGFQSLCMMIASSLAGLIWYNFGAGTTFIITGIAAIIVILYFTLYVKNPTAYPE
ncbi:MAG: MFS transporter [Saprospiraceae bacterium]|nr:MFS transporter [Saprospiraceae bacterium]